MSPERAEGKAVDGRSDIYSLGLVMYEMFTGESAFHGDEPLVLLSKQISETPPPPRGIESYLPGFLDEAIQKCLTKDPRQRFQSAQEVRAALAGRHVQAARRNRWLPSLVRIALPFAAMAVLVFFLKQVDRDPGAAFIPSAHLSPWDDNLCEVSPGRSESLLQRGVGR